MAFLRAPWVKGRTRHIPTQIDIILRFAPEHVVLFLGLCDLGSKGMLQGYYVYRYFL